MKRTKFHIKRTRTKPPVVKERNKGGRIGYYKDDFLRQVYLLGKYGARDEDIADFFNVHITTIDYWKKNKPDFLKAMKRGKWEFDTKIIKTLGRRALGYEVVEKERTKTYDKFGIPHYSTKRTIKNILPDITAIIFWLKNRQREMWADVNKTEFSGGINVNHQNTPIDMSSFSDEEKKLFRNVIIKKLSTINGISRN